jgi:inner membrane transporter RhtA
VAGAALLVGAGSVGVQSSSAISTALFPVLGVPATSAFRLACGAVLLLVVFRPAVRGRPGKAWAAIGVYGLSMAAMNLCLYWAVERLPLGVAVTLEFLGPCAVALAGSRRWADAVCALGALAGVGLIAGPGGAFDLVGYAAGLGAPAFFGV